MRLGREQGAAVNTSHPRSVSIRWSAFGAGQKDSSLPNEAVVRCGASSFGAEAFTVAA